MNIRDFVLASAVSQNAAASVLYAVFFKIILQAMALVLYKYIVHLSTLPMYVYRFTLRYTRSIARWYHVQYKPVYFMK